MWPQIVMFVVSLALSYYTRPKPPEAQPAGTLADIKVPTAEEGREIPVLFGTRDISNQNCVWYGNLKTRAIKK